MRTPRVATQRRKSLLSLPSARTVGAWLPFVALLALEAAPVQAWLMVYPTTQQGDLPAAAPFWLVVAILALFALARRRAARFGTGAVLGAWALAAGIGLLGLIRFSPLMFGQADAPIYSLDWAVTLWNGTFDPSPMASLIALLVYLGWRGSALGAPTPTFSVVSRRFSISLGALVLAIFGSLATVVSLRAAVSALLLALLALDGFAGLTALAMSRTQATSGSGESRMPGADYSARWQIAAVGIALAIMVVVTVIGGAVNERATSALLAWLTPVGGALSTVGYWLAQAIAYVLYLISVAWLSLFVPKNLPNQPAHLPKPIQGAKKPPTTHPIPAGISEAAAIIAIVIGVVVALVLIYALARMVANALNQPDEEDVEEEREDLDTRSLLSQQVRDWLKNWRRRGAARERDPLRRGGMRWLYRGVLRAAARAGYERHLEETPDEYGRRLATTLGEHDHEMSAMVTRQMRAVTDAYNDARYGANLEDPDAPAGVVEETSALRAYLESLDTARVPPRR